MSLAAETREAVRGHPFLLDGLRAGVVNYTAAARYLDVDGEDDAVATALRRFGEDLGDEGPDSDRDGSAAPGSDAPEDAVRVTMESGLGETDDASEALLAVGGVALAPDEGSLTGVLARASGGSASAGAGSAGGDAESAGLGPAALERVLGRLRAAEVDVVAAGAGGATVGSAAERAGGEALVVAVDRLDGANALRVVEDVVG